MKLQRSFSNSRNGEEEKSQSIPFELVMEILMRLPLKSRARFRCVSKVWDSTLVNPDNIEYFNTICSSRPNLLFTCLKDGKTFFFSSPKPQDSSPLAVNIHMSFPINFPFEICRPVRGLVCGLNQHGTLNGRTVTFPWICNPSTGESLTLPKLKTKISLETSYLGYDPIGKRFKVLCMAHERGTGTATSNEREILTLQPEKKPSWRKVLCRINHKRLCLRRSGHNTSYDGICINGVLYYLAYLLGGGGYSHGIHIVCFDFRSEKFKCIKIAQGMKNAFYQSTLVNYKDKLALLQGYIVDLEHTGYQLWVLEDAENQKWSNSIYVWQEKPVEENLCFVGISDTGEIVLSPKIISDSFYLIYYNPEKSTFTRVGIHGMEAFKGCIAYVFLDHVEDLRKVSRIMGSYDRIQEEEDEKKRKKRKKKEAVDEFGVGKSRDDAEVASRRSSRPRKPNQKYLH